MLATKHLGSVKFCNCAGRRGWNALKALGTASGDIQATPIAVDGNRFFQAISVGDTHTIALEGRLGESFCFHVAKQHCSFGPHSPHMCEGLLYNLMVDVLLTELETDADSNN